MNDEILISENYPNEIWRDYEHKLRNTQRIVYKVIPTKYMISSYGRCYSKFSSKIIPVNYRDPIYLIQINSKQTRIKILDMVAETFIPNTYCKPHAILLNKDNSIHVNNIGWSYYEDRMDFGYTKLDLDLQDLYSPEFKLEESNMWKKIIHSDLMVNYMVSRMGKVYNPDTNRFIAQIKNKDGYLFVNLYLNKGSRGFTVHRLVAQSFIPNPDNKPTVNHKNGNKSNNWDWNLEWATRSENTQHAYDTGLKHSISGTNHSMSKLSKEDVLEIISDYNKYKGVSDIAKKFNVTRFLIYRILNGQSYVSITNGNMMIKK